MRRKKTSRHFSICWHWQNCARFLFAIFIVTTIFLCEAALNLHILLSCKQMTLKLDNDEQNFFIERTEEKSTEAP